MTSFNNLSEQEKEKVRQEVRTQLIREVAWAQNIPIEEAAFDVQQIVEDYLEAIDQATQVRLDGMDFVVNEPNTMIVGPVEESDENS